MPEKIGVDAIGRKKKLGIQNRKEVSAEDLRIQIQKILEDIRQNPRSIDEDTKKELRTLLVGIEKSSRQTSPDISQKAQEWISSIQKGVSLSADIVQLFTFLSGITSLPMLFQVIAIANRIAYGSTNISSQFSFGQKKHKIPKNVKYI
jgi:hypothetical protein